MTQPSALSRRVLPFLFVSGALLTGCPGVDAADDSGVQDTDSGTDPTDAGPADGGDAGDGGAEDGGTGDAPPSGVFGWTRYQDVDQLLAYRWAPLVADLGDGRAVFFGGADVDGFGGSPLDDVHLFDGTDAEPVFTSLAVDGPVPNARYCGCAVYDPDRDVVLLIGGRSLGTFYSDVWELDMETLTFTDLGQGPEFGLGCALTYLAGEQSVYLFGGSSTMATSDALYKYNATGNAWTEVAVDGAKPAARYDAWLGTHDGKLLMTSGSLNAQQSFHGDVWSFDTATGTWTELAPDGAGPTGRRVPWVRKAADGSRFVLGFGNNGGVVLDDLWTFDLSNNTWTETTPARRPDARGWTPALPGGDGIIGYLLGGFDLDAPTGDLWRLDADADDTGF